MEDLKTVDEQKEDLKNSLLQYKNKLLPTQKLLIAAEAGVSTDTLTRYVEKGLVAKPMVGQRILSAVENVMAVKQVTV